jgi:serine/threonine-protein kinase
MQPADADDLVQQVLSAVARVIDRWEADPERARFRTWLQRVATNAIINAVGLDPDRTAPRDFSLGRAADSPRISTRNLGCLPDDGRRRTGCGRRLSRIGPIARFDLRRPQPRHATIEGEGAGVGGTSMNITDKKPTCDPDVLDLFLRDKLADNERVVLEEHLDDCVSCREQLERLAAEPALWTEAHDALSSAGDEPLPSGLTALDEDSSAASRPDADAVRPEQIRGFLSATDDPRMLGRFGGYEIAGVIGYGGMGVVLKGLDVALNRYVAIKVLAPHLATSAAARMRFAREARQAAAVVHENVTAIHSVSEANGLPYLVMPYVRGTSLQKRLDTQGPLSTAEVLRIGMQAARGLAAAHAQGLVHRDIKPANILLEDGIERLTITDFGLARAADDASLTRSGVIAGTPQYMSPEQARGEAIDARSDLFSLGSVLYTLCTGRAPFRAETPFGVLRRITDDTPRPIREINPEIPEWLTALVEKLHAKDLAQRFQSADEVARLFEQCLAHLQQPAAVPLPEQLQIRSAPTGSRQIIRRRWLIGASAAVLVVAAIGYALHDRSGERGPGDGRTPNETASSSGHAESGVPSPSAANHWDDGVSGEISELQKEIESFDASSAELWPVEKEAKE